MATDLGPPRPGGGQTPLDPSVEETKPPRRLGRLRALTFAAVVAVLAVVEAERSTVALRVVPPTEQPPW